MLLHVLTIIVPIFFVLLLGFAAGRARAFDGDQVAGINELVLDFALPATLFVGTVRTSRAQLLQQGPLLLALLVSVVGLFGVVALLGRSLFRHTLAESALQAIAVSFAAGPFFAPALLGGIYGASSAVTISLISLIWNVIIVPATVVLLEMSKTPPAPAKQPPLGSLVGSSLLQAIKTPFVAASLLALALVLIGVSVPPVIDSALGLIGGATAGVALFVAGLTIAANQLTVSRAVGVNSVLKMVGQPALYLLLAVALRVPQPYGHQGFLLSVLPTSPVAALLATRYKTYQSEASSTVALTTLVFVVVLPVALLLIGGR
jgi:predicted permease